MHYVKPTRVLFFGGGQDSTALLYLFWYDQLFRQQYAGDCHLVVIMSSTGNEYPATLTHIAEVATWCTTVGIEFYHLTPDMGYHVKTWHSLPQQMERNDNIMGVAFPKSCTDQLKISPAYRFLADWLRMKYGFTARGHRVYYQYMAMHGKLQSWIGFAAGEESRISKVMTSARNKRKKGLENTTAPPGPTDVTLTLFSDCQIKGPDYIPKWRKLCVMHRYPLIDLGLNRTGCQQLIASYGHTVPHPSNCMMCPFQAPAEIVYLYRHFPQMWNYWVSREEAKLRKFAYAKVNLGVMGKRTLPETLAKALIQYGTWSNERLEAFRFSHGHCVKSKM